MLQTNKNIKKPIDKVYDKVMKIWAKTIRPKKGNLKARGINILLKPMALARTH